jgi:hypothetical protein
MTTHSGEERVWKVLEIVPSRRLTAHGKVDFHTTLELIWKSSTKGDLDERSGLG